MEVVNVLIGLLGLSLLVFIHEGGHFLAAKVSGVAVEAFAIGWGKPIWRWKPKDTEYRVCIFPLGGYCKMKGEQYLIQSYERPGEVVEPEKGSLFAANPWKRIFISVAGPAFNFLFALLLFFSLQLSGVPQHSPANKIVLISSLENPEPFPAEKAGLRTGDLVKEIQDQDIRNYADLQEAVGGFSGTTMRIVVERDHKNQEFRFNPQWSDKDQRYLIGVLPWIDPVVKTVQPQSAAAIAGILPGDRILALNGKEVPYAQAIARILGDRSSSYQVELNRKGEKKTTQIIPDVEKGVPSLGLDFDIPYYPPIGKAFAPALSSALQKTTDLFSQMVRGLVQLVVGKANITESVSGPIRMINVMGEVTSASFVTGWGEGVGSLINILAFISLALFLMNLLPIPALDGGSIVISLLEAVRRKRLSAKVLIRYQQIGVFIILALVIFTTVNDVSHLFHSN